MKCEVLHVFARLIMDNLRLQGNNSLASAFLNDSRVKTLLCGRGFFFDSRDLALMLKPSWNPNYETSQGWFALCSEPLSLETLCRDIIVHAIGKERWLRSSVIFLPLRNSRLEDVECAGGWSRAGPLVMGREDDNDSSDVQFQTLSLNESDFSEDETVTRVNFVSSKSETNYSLISGHQPASDLRTASRPSVIMVPVKCQVSMPSTTTAVKNESRNLSPVASSESASFHEDFPNTEDNEMPSTLELQTPSDTKRKDNSRRTTSRKMKRIKACISTPTLSCLGAAAIPEEKLLVSALPENNSTSFFISSDEWKRITPIELKSGGRRLSGPWPDIFSTHLKVTNPYCSFAFRYNRVKRENSQKKRVPFFKGFGSCKKKGCSVSVLLTITAANESRRKVDVVYCGASQHRSSMLRKYGDSVV